MLAPHHGSKTSSSQPFLNAVRPDICIISSGRGGYFGFPHRETVEKLNEIGCRIIEIDKVGAVTITAEPSRFKLRSFLKGE